MTNEADEGYNPARRELGWDKSPPREHRGLDGASGFHWQIGPSGLGESIGVIWQMLAGHTAVRDEYEREIPIEDFRAMFKDILPQDTECREFP